MDCQSCVINPFLLHSYRMTSLLFFNIYVGGDEFGLNSISWSSARTCHYSDLWALAERFIRVHQYREYVNGCRGRAGGLGGCVYRKAALNLISQSRPPTPPALNPNR